MPSSLEFDFEFRNQRFSDAVRGLNVVADRLKVGMLGSAPRISHELKVYLEGVAEALAQRHGAPWPGGTTANTMSKRTGFMIESIKDSVKVEGLTIPTIVGYISIPRERKIHEKGGVLKPKKAKYLTIPLPAALDSRGVPLKPSARDWENTFVIKSKKGNLLIAQKQGVQLVFLYVLKSEVYIPPRLGAEDTLLAGKDYLVDKMADAVLKSLIGGLK